MKYLRLVKTWLAKFRALVESQILPLASFSLGERTDAHPKYQEATRSVAIALDEFAESDLTPGLLDVFNETSKHATREMSRVLGVSFKDIGFPQQRKQWLKQNVALIKSVSFDRLKDMEAILNGALPGQDRVEDVRGRLMDEFGLSKSRAELIARDQTLKLNSQLSQARATSLGVTTYTWVCSRDERVRGNPSGKYPNSAENHWTLHGKIFRYDTPPVVNLRTGETAHPGGSYQCRCVGVPNTDELLGL